MCRCAPVLVGLACALLACGGDDDEAPPDAASTVDAAPASIDAAPPGPKYLGYVAVSSASIDFQVLGDDGCFPCFLDVPAGDGCLRSNDYMPYCPATCSTFCVTSVRFESGGTVAWEFRPDNMEGNHSSRNHGLSPGASAEFVIDGCHGEVRIPVAVPTPDEAVLVDPPSAVTWQSARISWSPSAPDAEALVEAGTGLVVEQCRLNDTGETTVMLRADTISFISVDRRSRIGRLESSNADIAVFEYALGTWGTL